MDEKRLRQDLAGTMPPSDGKLKIAVHLVEQEMTPDLVQLVEYHYAVRCRPKVLQVVEEPFEEVSVVLPQMIWRRHRRRFGYHAGKRLASEAAANIHQFRDVGDLRLGQSGELA